jgi:alpha-L-rhamnosidase
MAMAIAKGIAPSADVPQLLANCIADMKAHYRGHYAAGHITHQLVYDAYSDHGLVETCFDMMNATGYPSFAWQLQSGNRTIPEGPTLPDALPAKASAYQDECQEPARWFTQTLSGIAPDRMEPGFKHILLCPKIPSRLPSASLITTTPYGALESSWKQDSGVVTWTVRIPANSYATAVIPASSLTEVKAGGRPLATAPGCKIQRLIADGVECRLGSGNYTFQFPAPANQPSRLGDGVVR